MLNRFCCPRGGRKVTWPESIFSTQPIAIKLFLSSADPLPNPYFPLLLEIERRRLFLRCLHCLSRRIRIRIRLLPLLLSKTWASSYFESTQHRGVQDLFFVSLAGQARRGVAAPSTLALNTIEITTVSWNSIGQ